MIRQAGNCSQSLIKAPRAGQPTHQQKHGACHQSTINSAARAARLPAGTGLDHRISVAYKYRISSAHARDHGMHTEVVGRGQPISDIERRNISARSVHYGKERMIKTLIEI